AARTTARRNCGGTDTFRKTISISKPAGKPVANFFAKYLAYRAGDVVAFTDLSTNNPYSWSWIITPNVTNAHYEFVNGTSANSQNPEIKFYDAGLYSIRLEIKNSLGSDGNTKANYIEVAFQCEPTVKKVSSDIGISHVKLTNISKVNIIDQYTASGDTDFTLNSYKNPVLLESGGTYNIEIERPTNFTAMRGAIWIDFNNNGFFNDPSELIIHVDSISTKKWGGKFTIPGAINPGISRLRIGVTFYNTILYSCDENFVGEFEDYTISLQPDKTGPVITLVGADTMLLEEGRIFSEPGANAFDNVDGDVSSKLRMNYVNLKNSVPGLYRLVYTVKDSAGNESNRYRAIKVIADTTAPRLELFSGDSIYVEIFKSYTEPGYFVADNVSPVIKVNVSGKVNANKFGTYILTYEAVDGKGNKTIK
ncbi:MAG: DUF5011 domain-containing protein, partial [Sphingobacteriales bacterium]